MSRPPTFDHEKLDVHQLAAAKSHQLLSRFRVSHGEVLDGLMTQVLGTLLHKGLLSLQARACTTDPEARDSCWPMRITQRTTTFGL